MGAVQFHVIAANVFLIAFCQQGYDYLLSLPLEVGQQEGIARKYLLSLRSNIFGRRI